MRHCPALRALILTSGCFAALSLTTAHAQFGGFKPSDLDPTNKDSALREGARQLDPTNPNSRVREGARELDPTNKNSAIRNPRQSAQEALQSTWGEVGRGAYPAAANAMAVRHGRHVHTNIAPWDKRALAVHFGNLVDDVTLVWGAEPLDSWGSNRFTIKLGGPHGSAAQTYGKKVYLAPGPSQLSDYDRLQLLAHELVHVQQNKRHGSMESFGYHYFRNYAKADFRYAKNSMEQEAFAVEEGEPMKKIWDAFATENTHKVFLENPTDTSINMQFAVNGGSKSNVTIPPRTTQWFSGVGRPPRFDIFFDADFGPQNLQKSYQLASDQTYHIVVSGAAIDVHRGSARQTSSPQPAAIAQRTFRPSVPDSDSPRLGIQTQYVDGMGMEVLSVGQNTPAARAGLEVGDFIVSVGGARVDSAEGILRVLADLAARGQRSTEIEVDNVRARNGEAVERFVRLSVSF